MKRDRNAYQLAGRAERRGYDWWWHSFVGVHRTTGRERPFYIEYYVINPGLSPRGEAPRLGDGQGGLPSYAMLKAGAWGLGAVPGGATVAGTRLDAPGPDAACAGSGDLPGLPAGHTKSVQIDNCWPVADFRASRERLDVAIGPNVCTETRLTGAVWAGQRLAPGGWPSARGGLAAVAPGPGVMTWDLTARKELAYSVGYGASPFFNALRAFRMFWHVGGMKTEYAGTVTLDGETYDVLPGRNHGYQDKNWGRDYTNPWIWLNCNDFRDEAGQALPDTSLDVGGGCPVAFGIPVGRRILVALRHRGELHEFNFAKFWRRGRQDYRCTVEADRVRWEVTVENATTKVEIDFSCPRTGMILVDYENPDGFRHHRDLWNGGWAAGTLKLYRRSGRGWALEETLAGSRGGCEAGEY